MDNLLEKNNLLRLIKKEIDILSSHKPQKKKKNSPDDFLVQFSQSKKSPDLQQTLPKGKTPYYMVNIKHLEPGTKF